MDLSISQLEHIIDQINQFIVNTNNYNHAEFKHYITHEYNTNIGIDPSKNNTLRKLAFHAADNLYVNALMDKDYYETILFKKRLEEQS